MSEVANATQSGTQVVLSSTEAGYLVALAVAACLICIYLVFSFGRRVQNAAVIRDNVVKTYAENELKDLKRALLDRAIDRPLDPNDPPPDFFGCHSQLWEPHLTDSYQAMYGQPKPGETDQQKKDREDKLKKCEEWDSREKERYDKLEKDLEPKARENAEKRMPKSWDVLSYLGGGYAFLLEFSTVIVIIFTILSLGILGILQGQEIATILAAIAGYVLGKASAGRSESGTEAKKAGS